MNILTPSGYKNIMSCSIGDEVIAYDMNDGHIIYNIIEAIEEWNSDNDSEFSSSFYLINDTYTMYKWQSVWANGNVTHINQLKVGDVIYDDEDQDIVITSITPTLPQTVWYRLEISGDHSYIADGITLHNASRFWVGGTGTWDASSTTNWSATTGGGSGASVPGAADTVTIDASSGTGTVTVNTNFTITSITHNTANITLDFSANNNNPTINTVTISGPMTMGNGTWTITGTTFNLVGSSFNSNDSTISFTNTSNTQLQQNYSAGQTLNRLIFNRGASTGIINFPLGGSTLTINTLIDNGTAAHTIQFQQLRNYSVGNFLVRGTPGNLVTIQSNGAGNVNLAKSPLGIVNTDYINRSTTAPVTVTANTFYIGTNSTGSGGNWIFSNYPARGLGGTGVG